MRMKMLVETLGPEDTVSIVAYAGSAGTRARADQGQGQGARSSARSTGLMAGRLDRRCRRHPPGLSAAEQSFDKTGINRVILATDGDFNVGITDPEELKSFVERKRETGVYALGAGLRPRQLQ